MHSDSIEQSLRLSESVINRLRALLPGNRGLLASGAISSAIKQINVLVEKLQQSHARELALQAEIDRLREPMNETCRAA